MHETMWSGGYGMWFGGHWLFMLLWIAIILPPFWKIFSKAGFSGWLSLLIFVPLVNLVVLYIVAMWISGVMQGLMWRATNAMDGTLTYSFVESVQASYPFWFMRFVGGLFIVAGMILMAVNCYRTIRAGSPTEEVIDDVKPATQAA